MKLSIDLEAPTDLPSRKELQQLFVYAEEMGLDKGFEDIHVYFYNRRRWIVFLAHYKRTFTGDSPNNTCLLNVVLEKNDGEELQGGRFRIWDPTVEDNIAYASILPYAEFISLVRRAQEIGALHRDIRVKWYELVGLKDLLPKVKHG